MAYSKTYQQVMGSPASVRLLGHSQNNLLTAYYGASRTMTKSGTRVEGYKSLISQRRDASSDYSFVRYTAESEPAYSHFRAVHSSGPALWLERTYSGSPGYNQVFGSYAPLRSNEALAKVYSKIRQTRSHLNGLTVLGELRETLKMIRRPATTLASGIASWADKARDIYQRDVALQGRRNRSRFQAVLHDTYLEAVFGLQPTISDVSSLAEAVGRLEFDHADRVQKIRVKVHNEGAATPELLTTSDPALLFSGPNPSIFRWERRKYSESDARWIVWLGEQISSDVPEGTYQRVARVTGLTFENVLPAAWELFPYSFLVDYFTNVGKVIEARFTDVTVVKFAVQTSIVKDTVEVITTYDPNLISAAIQAAGYVPTTLSGYGGIAKEIRTSLTRTRWQYLPIPHIQVFLPTSKWKYGNIVALALAKLNRVAA